MLMSSLTAESDSVFIDLLTYADLELLKSRKMGKPGPASSASKSNNKRAASSTPPESAAR